MRCIDADALIEKLEAWKDAADQMNANIHSAFAAAIMVQVQSEPTIEPEREKGEWIEDGYNHYKAVCNKCGEPCATYIMGLPRDRYCKWCGSYMREENG